MFICSLLFIRLRPSHWRIVVFLSYAQSLLICKAHAAYHGRPTMYPFILGYFFSSAAPQIHFPLVPMGIAQSRHQGPLPSWRAAKQQIQHPWLYQYALGNYITHVP